MNALATDTHLHMKAKISMKYDVSVYKRNRNEFERIPKEYLKRGNSYFVIDINDEYIQLENGNYIVNVDPQQYDIEYGEVILNERIPICSRNGVILRYAEEQAFKIREIHENCIGIGNKEYISAKRNITVITHK